MAIKIEMLRCFCAAAEAGNLSDAADRLGRTQSAVSMTLKQLESDLGAPLFESERKNRLTPLGRQVFALGKTQIRQFDSTVGTIKALARAPQGILRIAAVPSVAAIAFPQIVRQITAKYPGVKVELRDADTPQVVEAMLQGWADIGIASASQTVNGTTHKVLFSDPFGAVFSQTHPLAQKATPVTLDDILQRPFLRNSLCEQILPENVLSTFSSSDVTVHNTQSLLAMIRQGDWITLLPRSTVETAPDGIVFAPLADLNRNRQVYLYTRDHPASPEIMQDAIDAITTLQWVSPY